MSDKANQLVIRFVSKHEAQVLFGDEMISWNIFPYFKGSNTLTHDIFEQINDYLKQVSKDKQKKIFNCYKGIFSLLETPTSSLDNDLKKLVAELYNNIDLNDIKNWIDIKANIVIPTKLEEIYQDTDENTGNRNRTYIKEDYRWLLALSVALRLMLPVWGEYISRTHKEKGNNFKEYYAAALLELSNIQNSIPMTKLKLFVIENIPKDRAITSALMAAFSAEDFPDWLGRLVIVRKLCLEDIRGVNTKYHLIEVIFQYIKHRIRTVDSNFFGIIKEKFTPESNNTSDDNNNLSKIEGYKIRQEIAAGDVALIRKSLSDPYDVARKLAPDIDLKLVDEAIKIVSPLENIIIEKAQKTLLQFVLRPVCPPSGVLLLKKVDLVRNMGVALAVLWNAGWYDIALLMTALEIPNDEYLSISFTGNRTRITKAQMDKIDYLYPYTKRPQGKQRVVKFTNVAVAEIEKLNEVFIKNDWKLLVPQSWLNKSNLTYKLNKHTAPADLRNILADFVIALAENERPFSKHKDKLNLS